MRGVVSSSRGRVVCVAPPTRIITAPAAAPASRAIRAWTAVWSGTRNRRLNSWPSGRTSATAAESACRRSASSRGRQRSRGITMRLRSRRGTTHLRVRIVGARHAHLQAGHEAVAHVRVAEAVVAGVRLALDRVREVRHRRQRHRHPRRRGRRHVGRVGVRCGHGRVVLGGRGGCRAVRVHEQLVWRRVA